MNPDSYIFFSELAFAFLEDVIVGVECAFS